MFSRKDQARLGSQGSHRSFMGHRFAHRSWVESLEQRVLLTIFGPDGFGYIADDAVPFAYEDISVTGTPLNLGDDAFSRQNIGFNFNFYGTTYADVYVGSNGFLTFGGSNTSPVNENLNFATGTAIIDPVIAGLWDDWNSTLDASDNIYVQTLGTPGVNQRFIAQWRNLEHDNANALDDPVDFEIVLFESGDFELRYEDVVIADSMLPILEPESNGGTATVGIRNREPTAMVDGEVLQISFEAPNINDQQTIQYTRQISKDRFESNDTISDATVLGSLPKITLRDLTLHDDGIDNNGDIVIFSDNLELNTSDEDFYKITAQDTGKLIINAFFVHAMGDIDMVVEDMDGNAIAYSFSADDNEKIIIPVVSQEMYFVHVLSGDFIPNEYFLEIENFPAPVPSGVRLDPANDTGMMNDDNVTADTTPRFIIQADLADFESMFNMNPSPVPSGAIDSDGMTGADVEVHITGINTGISVVGNATRIGGSNLWQFTPAAPLVADTYFVSAAVNITDGQGTPVTDRTQLSEPILITIDTAEPPKGMVLETFAADLEGDQAEPMVATDAGGTAVLKLNPAGNRLEMTIELVGVDLDENQTPGIVEDNVTALHIHNGAPGVNGSVVFGLIVPNGDLNNDWVMDAAAGRISSAWDVAEGLNAAQLANLRSGDLYINVHTVGNDTGEIRGQIMPTVGTVHMLQSSDAGMSLLDNVTSKMAPAFTGKAEANTKVRVLARNANTGTVNLVGHGVVGTDLTDGVPGDGFGIWEVTVEPMADGAYEIFVEFEDSAGNITMHFDFSATDLPQPIVDNASQEFGLDVQHLFGDIRDIDVKLDISHRIVEGLDVFLISPNGTPVELFSDLTNVTGDDFVDMVLDDEAATSITAGDTPFTGSFRPEQPLSTFDGEDPNGTWLLRIIDDSPSPNVDGILNDVRLCITTGLPIVIDTVAPNTPFLDLLEDTGRSDVDNVTMENAPSVSMTTEDPNVQFAQTLFTDNLKFRIFDRFEGSEEFLLYDSSRDGAVDNVDKTGDAFTRLQLILETLGEQFVALNGVGNFAVNDDGTLVDGEHNLKLEAEDRAGNMSHDFLLNVTIDIAGPPKFFGDSGSAIDGIHPDSDTGVIEQVNLFVDRITSDTTPTFFGEAEANAVITAFVVTDDNGTPAIPTDDTLIRIGQTVAIPLDGNDALSEGHWSLTSDIHLNDPLLNLPLDGLRTIRITGEDVAGNVSNDQLEISLDTRGPQVGSITVFKDAGYDLFDPKPSTDGPTPQILGLDVQIIDQPPRIAAFDYAAVNQILATTIGNYQLIGDHSGNILIESVDFIDATVENTERATVRLNFSEALPDDRFTLTIRDSIMDDAGNALDGESQAASPFETNGPIFPSGDGVPGGDFVARFTVDSRPEIGTYCCGSITTDTNGNLVFDPEGEDNDATNRDLTFVFGLTTDSLFTGNFPMDVGSMASGFDKLGVYGFADGSFRFLLDVDHDGAFNPAVDRMIISAVQINALPVAGNFDGNAANGDEIGLFDGERWFLDLNGDQILNEAPIETAMRGRPIVGDFNGDGIDDLATYDPALDTFFFSNGLNGTIFDTLAFGFTGITERPVAADLNLDGVDDLGLWVPDRNTQPPDELAEWFFLISDPIVNDNVNLPSAHFGPFAPDPLGNDIFAQFGDVDALPLIGNWDPPTTSNATQPAQTDFTGDDLVDAEDVDILFEVAGDLSITDPVYDADGGGALSSLDVDYMVEEILGRTPGDTDGNGVVDIFDVSRVVGNFDPFGTNYTWQDGDFDGDGDIDIRDITALISNFNPLRTAIANDAVLATDSAEAVGSDVVSSSASASTSVSETSPDDGALPGQAAVAGPVQLKSQISDESVAVWHQSSDAELLSTSGGSRTRSKLGILPAEEEGLDS